ncbi:uncharacterized protein METZ01_LOCUS381270 [marine metagenome]|uniref:Uncharacterized protein n=1 Tax=marine metagenome TaxID=408172 RepID=A0A382U273_9ZZZZ
MGIKIAPTADIEGMKLYALEYETWDGKTVVFEEYATSLVGLLSMFKKGFKDKSVFKQNKIQGVTVNEKGKRVDVGMTWRG